MSEKTIEDYNKDYTEPELRQKLKEEIKQNDKGGKSGQWSARKSQFLKREYEKQGGSYKHPNNKTQNQEDLTKWSKQDWQTNTGQEAIQKNKTKRYLPKKVWDNLSEEERKQAEDNKIIGSKQNKQYVGNTKITKEAIKHI